MKAFVQQALLAVVLAAALLPAQLTAAVLLSELKVNPPGPTDAPYEFIEIRGSPETTLTNVHLLVIEGNHGNDPGRISYYLNLSGARFGTAGVLVIAATNTPYLIPTTATLISDPQLNSPGGALPNGTVSFLLTGSASTFTPGQDLDKDDNGVLEGLPADAVILDAVGWSDGDKGDLVYGGVALHLTSGTPDAATRFSSDQTPCSAAAWFGGNLAGTNADSLAYDLNRASPNCPPGATLVPGLVAGAAPTISPLTVVSGVIGDPWNPTLDFVVSDPQVAGENLAVTASSSNQSVVPDTNLIVTAGLGGWRSLSLKPVGVGYAQISLRVSNGTTLSQITVPYAASAMGRPGGRWHLGASDGSTAIAVDADFMLVGDDENQTIRLYHRQRSDLPVRAFDMGPFLSLPDAKSGLPREVDIEASTRIGNRLFWMGSLGHSAEGETRTNRTRVFATELSGSGPASVLTYVGRYDFLKVDLIEWDRQNLHGKGTNYYGLDASDAPGVPPKAPDGSGFAIEGLAMMPGSTNGAYIAFRAPIVPPTNRTYALIVPVLNFATVAASTGPPGSCVFGPPIELDLYGRGIRSLEGGPTVI